MNNDLGVWTSQDCALVLIDYQKEIFATIRSETRAFREAVKKTGRQRLIFGGLHTEISPFCLNIRVAVIGHMMGHVATIGLPHEDRTWRADRCLSAGETL